MASPWATLAGILRGDVANLEAAHFHHANRRRFLKNSGCEVPRVLADALTCARTMPAQEMRHDAGLSE
jgi:hypothetical protein